MTSLLDITSKRPSVANTTIEFWFSFNFIEFTLGRHVIPILLAIKSPMLLLIANPGNFSFFNQTQRGPTGFPVEFLIYSINPPFFKILFFNLAGEVVDQLFYFQLRTAL